MKPLDPIRGSPALTAVREALKDLYGRNDSVQYTVEQTTIQTLVEVMGNIRAGPVVSRPAAQSMYPGIWIEERAGGGSEWWITMKSSDGQVKWVGGFSIS